MRLRRLEFAIIAITLAFGFFIGGFFTGRNHRAINITAVAVQSQETPETNKTSDTSILISQQETENQSPGAAQNQISDSTEKANTTEPAQTAESKPQPQSGNTGTADDFPDNSTGRSGTGAPRYNDGKININTATHGELTDLPGIGNTLATRIIDYRTQNGNFSKIEDIRKVSGIGERRFEAIAELITAG